MTSGSKFLIIIGLLTIFVGLSGAYSPKLLHFLFAWFGNLPGDFKYHNGETTISMPLMSILFISLAVGFVSHFFR